MLVWFGLLVLCVQWALRSALVRVAGTGLVAVLALTGCAFALPFAPRQVRTLPVVHRVVAVVDKVAVPWRPQLPEHLPAAPTPTTQPSPSAPAPSPTPLPAAPTAIPQPTLEAPLPNAVKLEGIRHQWQTWNNCGPATVTMATSFFGRRETQVEAARFLKPNEEDKNVSPHELVGYAKSLGLEAQSRVGGDLTRLKQLLAAKVPVIVEVWIAPAPNDWMGHYRLLVGYDDRAGQFIAYDSVTPPGPNLSQPYARFDEDWRVFNRTYIPVYTKELAPTVEKILGPDLQDGVMYERALAAAQREVLMTPEDGFAWFNVGSSLAGLGRHAEAAAAFDKARALRLPFRLLWYQFAPFESYLAVGRSDDVLSLTAANLQRTVDLEESHFYRGRALQLQGKAADAKAAFQAALKANNKFAPAQQALATTP